MKAAFLQTIVSWLAVLGMIAVSASMNYRFGFSLGTNHFDGQVYGLASLASDIFKFTIPFLVLSHFKLGAYIRLGFSCVIGIICISYSLTSSMGYASNNRAITAGDRQIQADDYASQKKKLKRLEAKLDWMPLTKPVDAIEADLKRAKLTQVKFKRRRTTVEGATRGCKATNWVSKKYCKQIFEDEKQLAIAKDRLEVEQQIVELNNKITKSTGIAAVGKTDPQAEFLAALSGLKLDDTQLALILLVALLVEAVSTFGPFVISTACAGTSKYDGNHVGNDGINTARKVRDVDDCFASRGREPKAVKGALQSANQNNKTPEITSVDQWVDQWAIIKRKPIGKPEDLYLEYTSRCQNPVTDQAFYKRMNKILGKHRIKRTTAGRRYPIAVREVPALPAAIAA